MPSTLKSLDPTGQWWRTPSTQEAEAGGFLSSMPAWYTEWVPGQPGLHRETLSRKTKKKKKKKKKVLIIVLSSTLLGVNWESLREGYIFIFPGSPQGLVYTWKWPITEPNCINLDQKKDKEAPELSREAIRRLSAVAPGHRTPSHSYTH
jgi:hypothetical protein